MNWLKKYWAWVTMAVAAAVGAVMAAASGRRRSPQPQAPPAPSLPPVEIPPVGTSPSDDYEKNRKPVVVGKKIVIDDLNSRHGN